MEIRKLLWYISLCAALLGLYGVLGGCIFSPKTGKGKGPDPVVFPDPQYPADALDRLVKAYAYAIRDSTVYQAMIDSAYVGTSQDGSGNPIAYFYKADEDHHAGGLRRATTITSLDLSLGTVSSWQRIPSQNLGHPEWAEIQISGSQFRLEVNDNVRGTLVVNNQATVYAFRFKPSPAPQFHSDTSWTLVEWTETNP